MVTHSSLLLLHTSTTISHLPFFSILWSSSVMENLALAAHVSQNILYVECISFVADKMTCFRSRFSHLCLYSCILWPFLPSRCLFGLCLDCHDADPEYSSLSGVYHGQRLLQLHHESDPFSSWNYPLFYIPFGCSCWSSQSILSARQVML